MANSAEAAREDRETTDQSEDLAILDAEKGRGRSESREEHEEGHIYTPGLRAEDSAIW